MQAGASSGTQWAELGKRTGLGETAIKAALVQAMVALSSREGLEGELFGAGGACSHRMLTPTPLT